MFEFKNMDGTQIKRTNPRILLVEDDPISAQRVSAVLKEINAEVVVVTGGQAALDLFQGITADFDLILMDLFIPGMDGEAIAAAIRATDCFKRNPMPVVAITSNSLMERKEDFLRRTGFLDYVMKPVRPETFPALIRKHLDTAQLQKGWF